MSVCVSSILFSFYFSMIFGLCVFYKAAKENKLVYNKRQVQSLGIFFCLSIFYCVYYYLVGISIVNLGLKIKLFLWCFYFIVLKQFLVMVDRRKLFIRIFFILSILTLVALPWTLGIHGPYLSNSKSLMYRNIYSHIIPIGLPVYAVLCICIFVKRLSMTKIGYFCGSYMCLFCICFKRELLFSFVFYFAIPYLKKINQCYDHYNDFSVWNLLHKIFKYKM